MAKLNLSPTKSNLIKVKQDFVIAKEGHELLEQKREILVLELMSYVERVKRLEKELDTLLFDAYFSLKNTFVVLGHENTKAKAKLISYDYLIRKKSLKILGKNLPSIEIEQPILKLQYSFLNTRTNLDETSMKFLKLIPILSELAEIRNIVWRLSQEVKRTQRRVNALEKVILPDNTETIKFIESSLEEQERSEMFIRKLVKKNLEARNERSH